MKTNQIDRLEKLLRYYRKNVFSDDSCQEKISRVKALLLPAWQKRAETVQHNRDQKLLFRYL